MIEISTRFPGQGQRHDDEVGAGEQSVDLRPRVDIAEAAVPGAGRPADYLNVHARRA